MTSHEILVQELPMVNNMSTDDRLDYAQKRRAEQLVQWRKYEQSLTNNNARMTNGTHEGSKLRNVKFNDCVTLLEAAARNDYDEVEYLLKELKVNPDEANEDGLTALHQACIDNFDEVVELLLDYNTNVNAVDSEYWTPLHAACTCGHTEIAKILVNRGADLLALNADHNMPYDISEEEDTLEFIEQTMAKRGITQDQINDARSAREKQILKDLKESIKQGQDIKERDGVGATLLHLAAANGYVELMRYFLAQTTEAIDTQDKDGWTPLHAAACWCQLETVQVLGIEYNANPSIKNELGEIPADITDDEEIKNLLHKLIKTQKDRDRKNKLIPNFPRLNNRNSSTRASGVRGQSFKGRSKRDKKSKGISAAEAKSEAQFWTKGKENNTEMFPKDSSNSLSETSQGAADIGATSPSEKRSISKSTSLFKSRNKGKNSTSFGKADVSGKSNQAKANISKQKSLDLQALRNDDAVRGGSYRVRTDAELNKEQSDFSGSANSKPEEMRNLYRELTTKKRRRKKQSCVIL